jgi:DNA-binding response OmpR family regulator
MSMATAITEWFPFLQDKATGEIEDSHDLLQKGDFCLDMVARKASVCGRQLELSADEFDLLHFLLSHPKNFVTPRTVLVSGRRMRRTDFMKTLLSLRNRLASEAGGGNYLRTEPWVFYRFSPNH